MLTELSALLDLLKAKGVTHYEGPGNNSSWMVRVDFGPAAAAPSPVLPDKPTTKDDEKDEAPDDVCRCGHDHAQHTNGLCLVGCDVEKCAPEED